MDILPITVTSTVSPSWISMLGFKNNKCEKANLPTPSDVIIGVSFLDKAHLTFSAIIFSTVSVTPVFSFLALTFLLIVHLSK